VSNRAGGIDRAGPSRHSHCVGAATRSAAETLMLKTVAPATMALLLALAPTFTEGAEVADADAARKKPLQRCDQLSDKAEVECLQKARERIVDARRKRESEGKGDATSNAARPGASTVPARK
jgi:hypothetical protein